MAIVSLHATNSPSTIHKARSSIQPADSSSPITQLDDECIAVYRDLFRPYEEYFETQAAFTLPLYNVASAHALTVVRQQAPTAYEDFERRVKTGIIPSDTCNFHACLAGSVIMSGIHNVRGQGADKITAALWQVLDLVQKEHEPLTEIDRARQQLIDRLRAYLQSSQYAEIEQEYARNSESSLLRRWGFHADASDEEVEISLFGSCLHYSDIPYDAFCFRDMLGEIARSGLQTRTSTKI